VDGRPIVGGEVGHGDGVEDHDVGEGALAEHAAVADPDARRRNGAQLRDGCVSMSTIARSRVVPTRGGRPVRAGCGTPWPRRVVGRRPRRRCDGDPARA
jgi:hypothetical protein